MLESRIVEIDGTFLGTLILGDDRVTRRFYAAHEAVRSCHNRVSRAQEELRREIERVFRHAVSQKERRESGFA